MFTPRLTKPEKGNKYYNTIANGGISTAIVGSPTDAGCNVLANCVGYAAGRFNEIIGSGRFQYFNYPPNAEDFCNAARAAGLTVGTVPKPGAVIVWAKGEIGNGADGAGHVGIVEQVNPDGSIVTSESGWSAAKPFWTSARKDDGNWGQSATYRFIGFIYPPTVGFAFPARPLKRTCVGADVKWLQHMLRCFGCYTEKIDGSFGRQTLKALLLFQYEHSLAIDGVCGPATRAALTSL